MVLPNTLLIVDDDEVNRMMTRGSLESRFDRVLEASSGTEALGLILERNEPISLVLLDLLMPGMDGIEVLRTLRARGVGTPVIVCSANHRINLALEAIRLGAKEYVEKPIQPEKLLRSVDAVLSGWVRSHPHGEAVDSRFSLVGKSPALMRVKQTIDKVARSDCTVFIHGESDTGKEMVARAIHYLGPRASDPFQVVDCGSLSSSLLESELFGHEKDAFTGANARRVGLIQAAGNGTVFLDEIGDLPLEMQARILRALQDRQIRPLGSNEYVEFKARLVAATNRDLAPEVRKGRFREDLFHRLNVVMIEIPPLRERKEDIPALVEFFLAKHAIPGSPTPALSGGAMTEIVDHPWPGNIRELENAIERAINLADGDELTSSDIIPPPSGLDEPGSDPAVSPEPPAPRALEDLERDAIERAITASKGNRRIAARLVGISEATLYRKLRQYGMR